MKLVEFKKSNSLQIKMFRVLLLMLIFGTCQSKSLMKGGQDAKWGQFPAVVSITTTDAGRSCTGSIYNARHVITSAQCISGSGNKIENAFWYRITAGDISLTKSTIYRTERNVTNIFVHKNFNSVTLENDVALLRTDNPFRMPHNTIEPAELNRKIIVSTTKCHVVGWNTFTDSTTSVNQEFVMAEILDLDLCRTQHSRAIFESNLCAVSKPLAGICEDNAGSGLYCDGELAGILSTAQSCLEQVPMIFTQLRFYEDWLKSTSLLPEPYQPGRRPAVSNKKNNG